MTMPRHILIKGRGVAAAMAAAYLGRMLPRQYYHITCFSSAKALKDEAHFGLFHSDIREFNRLLKIKEVDFLQKCDGVFSLGDRVTDEKGHDYMNTFCPYGLSINGVSFMAALQKSGASGQLSDWEDCNLAAKMARSGKFLPPDPKGRPIIGDYSYGYQINPVKYRELLLGKAQSFGVSVKQFSAFNQQDAEKAFLVLNCEQSDFDYDFVKTKDNRQTNHVHQHISDDYVKTIFNTQSARYEISTGKDDFVAPASRFKSDIWRDNALYLSELPHFLPFLGDTSRLVQISLVTLMDLFPSGDRSDAERKEFNTRLIGVISRFNDFQSILLASSGFSAMTSEKLSEEACLKLDLFSARGRLAVLDDHSLFQDHWISMLLGQGFWPKGLNLMSKSLSDQQVQDFRENYSQIVNQALGQMPKTSDFIRKTCPSLERPESLSDAY